MTQLRDKNIDGETGMQIHAGLIKHSIFFNFISMCGHHGYFLSLVEFQMLSCTADMTAFVSLAGGFFSHSSCLCPLPLVKLCVLAYVLLCAA